MEKDNNLINISLELYRELQPIIKDDKNSPEDIEKKNRNFI